MDMSLLRARNDKRGIIGAEALVIGLVFTQPCVAHSARSHSLHATALGKVEAAALHLVQNGKELAVVAVLLGAQIVEFEAEVRYALLKLREVTLHVVVGCVCVGGRRRRCALRMMNEHKSDEMSAF